MDFFVNISLNHKYYATFLFNSTISMPEDFTQYHRIGALLSGRVMSISRPLVRWLIASTYAERWAARLPAWSQYPKDIIFGIYPWLSGVLRAPTPVLSPRAGMSVS